jgi:outer membrane protein assembly factor BamB
MVYAVDARTAEQRWTFPTQDIIFSAPAIAEGIIYIGSSDQNLYAVDSHTGRQKWLFRSTAGVSSPAVANGVVFVGDEDGTLYALH